MLEPRAPRPELRLRALGELAAAGYSLQPADDAGDPRPDRRAGGYRKRGASGTARGRKRRMVAFAFPKAVGGTPLYPIRQGALSRSGGLDRRILRARGICSARLRRTAWARSSIGCARSTVSRWTIATGAIRSVPRAPRWRQARNSHSACASLGCREGRARGRSMGGNYGNHYATRARLLANNFPPA